MEEKEDEKMQEEKPNVLTEAINCKQGILFQSIKLIHIRSQNAVFQVEERQVCLIIVKAGSIKFVPVSLATLYCLVIANVNERPWSLLMLEKLLLL